MNTDGRNDLFEKHHRKNKLYGHQQDILVAELESADRSLENEERDNHNCPDKK